MSASILHDSVQTEPLGGMLSRAIGEWRSTFDGIDVPILLVDPAGRIARLNRSAQRLAGRPFDELVGGALATLGSRQPWTEAGRLVEEVRRYRVATSGQVRDEQGRSWELLASLAPAETPAEERVIVSARDVSAVVHLEASLHRAEGVAAIGNLVAGIAHEVRNPLFAISAIVEAIAERVGSGAGLDAHVGTLRQEVDRLSRLMQELFDYGKAGVVELERCDLGEIVGVVAETYSRAASEAQVTLHNGVPARVAELRLDPQRVRQALGNLVQNALQHSPPGSTVALDAWTSRSAVGAWVDVAVIDSGPGFHPPDLPSVFEPFFSRRRGGTGLGLSMVKRIAEAHGGHVKAENRPDGGALVVLSLALDAASGRPGQG